MRGDGEAEELVPFLGTEGFGVCETCCWVCVFAEGERKLRGGESSVMLPRKRKKKDEEKGGKVCGGEKKRNCAKNKEIPKRRVFFCTRVRSHKRPIVRVGAEILPGILEGWENSATAQITSSFLKIKK